MEFYEITLEPLGGFGTPLKGDTLFGHFCWQASYDDTLLEGGLDGQMKAYPDHPFVVFSSAFPKLCAGKGVYALKRPDVPTQTLFATGGERLERMRLQKQLKAKRWMLVEDLNRLDCSKAKFMTDHELQQEISAAAESVTGAGRTRNGAEGFPANYVQAHNTINRMTQATKSGMFAPFSKENFFYTPGTRLALFVLIDPRATDIGRVRKGLERIGAWGFGRDASTGLGRFSVVDVSALRFPENPDANACYTLAPSVPAMEAYRKVYFSPFVRFGKHGDRLACSRNPFKNPVVMADEGAVLIPGQKDPFCKPYLGTAVRRVSKALPETVVQGYAPFFPIKVEL
ncbi:MAG: hypothetical protein PHS17_19380 [Desulfobacterales bacterium]|nr:hypothetical protein [Desulfobacterales bacterium]